MVHNNDHNNSMITIQLPKRWLKVPFLSLNSSVLSEVVHRMEMQMDYQDSVNCDIVQWSIIMTIMLVKIVKWSIIMTIIDCENSEIL
jgi:hypothetical protein